jgi:dimethylhistidine N-methyltransferase
MAAPARVGVAPSLALEFARDVRRDLSLPRKQLQSKYLYDVLGSALFEAICRLPWYKITRAERELLALRAPEIVAALPSGTTVIELGGGSGEKLAMIVEEMGRAGRRAIVRLIDISEEALAMSEQRLQPLEHVSVVGHRATYEEGLREAGLLRRAGDRWCVLFLGSNLGNFDPPEQEGFLRQIRSAMRPGDSLLLGADLVKPEKDLLLAYDDPLGVTAAFDKNVLARINSELGGDFDLGAFAHRAVWNAPERRIEMHLESLAEQTVTIRAADLRVRFERGETIWTESSYKFSPVGVTALGERSGFGARCQWVESEAGFALNLLDAD